jgi:hypothetical protein
MYANGAICKASMDIVEALAGIHLVADINERIASKSRRMQELLKNPSGPTESDFVRRLPGVNYVGDCFVSVI